MDPKFQTSFIPKKPLGQPAMGLPGGQKAKKAASSLFMTISVIVFIASLLGAGGAYAWKQILLSSRDSYQKELSDREKQFNPTLINQLKEANVKIDTARQLLANHLASSEIFDIVRRFTVENVRFLSMDIASPLDGSSGLSMSLQGYGTSFSAIAFQSQVLGQLEQYGLRQVVKNPIISDPSLGQNGTVAFGFSATIDPTSISYERSITPSSATTTP